MSVCVSMIVQSVGSGYVYILIYDVIGSSVHYEVAAVMHNDTRSTIDLAVSDGVNQ